MNFQNQASLLASRRVRLSLVAKNVGLYLPWRSLPLCDLRVDFFSSDFIRHATLCTLLILTLILPAPSFAKSGDRKQPIHVVADRADLNQVTGIGVYRGKVRITQGSIVLTADEVTVIAPGRELQQLIASSDDQGSRAKFRQLTDDGREITARAMRMEYEPSRARITLFVNAVLGDAVNRFAADRIVYHVDRQVVDAGGGKRGGRVEMTLVPQNEDGVPASER
jgi:lipopolysaccharide export system protein LptA